MKTSGLGSGLLSASLLGLATLSCKTFFTANESETLTDETKSIVSEVCGGLPPERFEKELMEEACACLDRRAHSNWLRRMANDFCGAPGQAYFGHVDRTYRAEAVLVMTDDAGTPPNAQERQCAASLASFHRDITLEDVVESCKNGSDQELRARLALTTPAPPGACWRLTRMTEDRCVIASPCVGRGPAKLKGLGLTHDQLTRLGGDREIAEGREIRLCDTRVQGIHELKDPGHDTLKYNYTFANALTFSRGAKKITYGAANCHGTAQFLAGNFLKSTPVAGLTYHSPTVKQQCEPLAKRVFDAQVARARTQGQASARADSLPIERGGFVINMNHDVDCAAQDCGTTTLQTQACSDTALDAYILVEGMCINCWDARLQQAGFRRLRADATWRELTNHCVLTAQDHSVTVTFVNDGFCYFYESLAPHSAPQMNVMECPRLFAKYPRRWCADSPFPWTVDAQVIGGD